MLPKIWKKLLLAICIIACLFNITSKLVNRISLEKTILSVPEGVNIKEVLNITDENPVITNNSNNSDKYNNTDNSNMSTNNTSDYNINNEGDLVPAVPLTDEQNADGVQNPEDFTENEETVETSVEEEQKVKNNDFSAFITQLN